jgi:hypothetical protein
MLEHRIVICHDGIEIALKSNAIDHAGIGRRNFHTQYFLSAMARIARKSQRDGSARPIRNLRFVYRIFLLCQSRMGIDPRDGISWK